MIYCNLPKMLVILASFMITVQAAQEVLLNASENAPVKIRDILGPEWKVICTKIAADPYCDYINTEGKALVQLNQLLKNGTKKYENLDPKDPIRKKGIYGGYPVRTRKLFMLAIYMYTVDKPFPKVFGMMNYFGRCEYKGELDFATNAEAGYFAEYSHYAGLLNLAVQFLLKFGPKHDKPVTTYRGMNFDKTCTDCKGTGKFGVVACRPCRGRGVARFDLAYYFNTCQGAGGFVSSAVSRGAAEHFANGVEKHHPHSVIVQFEETTQGAPISRYSYFPGEGEVLFHPRSNHVVKGVFTTHQYTNAHGNAAVHIVLADPRWEKGATVQVQQNNKSGTLKKGDILTLKNMEGGNVEIFNADGEYKVSKKMLKVVGNLGDYTQLSDGSLAETRKRVGALQPWTSVFVSKIDGDKVTVKWDGEEYEVSRKDLEPLPLCQIIADDLFKPHKPAKNEL